MSRSVRVVSFASVAGAPIRLTTIFITSFFTLGNGFVTLFSTVIKMKQLGKRVCIY